MFFLSWLTALGSGTGVAVLDHRDRLTSKDGLVNPEGGGVDLHEPEVSGHTVTDGDLNDVSRDDVDGLDLLHAILVGPDHLAGLGLVLLQSLDSLLSVPLLPDTDNSVGDQDEQDDKGLDEGGDRVVILEEGEDEGDDGGEEQDLDKQVIELFQDQLKDGLSLLNRQLVGAVLLLVLLHLSRAQTPLFINTEVLGALLPGLLESVFHGEKRPHPLWLGRWSTPLKKCYQA